MAGAFLFEMFHERWLLLVFPNTFEYFFIAYELVRTRWRTRSVGERAWIVVAAFIWIVIKLPQETWLHVLQLDVTDTLHDHPWTRVVLVGGLVAIAAILWFVVRPRVPAPNHALQLSAGPVPAAVDTAAELAALRIAGGWVLSWMSVVKIFLVGLVSVIYGQILPGVTASTPRRFISIGVLVAINAAITLLFSRRSWNIESAGLSVVVRIGVNVALVFVAGQVLGRNADGWDTFFFLCLISLLTTLHDRYQPVAAYRRREAATSAVGPGR
jgi:hypothetical protein